MAARPLRPARRRAPPTAAATPRGRVRGRVAAARRRDRAVAVEPRRCRAVRQRGRSGSSLRSTPRPQDRDGRRPALRRPVVRHHRARLLPVSADPALLPRIVCETDRDARATAERWRSSTSTHRAATSTRYCHQPGLGATRWTTRRCSSRLRLILAEISSASHMAPEWSPDESERVAVKVLKKTLGGWSHARAGLVMQSPDTSAVAERTSSRRTTAPAGSAEQLLTAIERVFAGTRAILAIDMRPKVRRIEHFSSHLLQAHGRLNADLDGRLSGIGPTKVGAGAAAAQLAASSTKS